MEPALYLGDVSHRRVRPVRHALSYRVFTLFVDPDQLPDIASRSRLLGYNKAGVLSIHDRDHAERDGRPIGDWLRGLAAQADCGSVVKRFMMLTYPRILGYVFNPLTVYYGLDANGGIRLMVYEVNNTFGEHMTYVLPADARADGTVCQKTEKRFYVSPFNDVSGQYRLRTTRPAETLSLGVALRDGNGPVLSASFHGERHSLTDRALMRGLAETGWMTVKVFAGIHLEALKLFLKGLRIRPRPRPPHPPLHVARSRGGPS